MYLDVKSNQLEYTMQRTKKFKQNHERVQYLQEIEFRICILYWEKSKGIKVSRSNNCSECKRQAEEEIKSYERQSKRDSFASRLIRSLSPSRSPERREESEELKDISSHKHYKIASIDAFMHRFKSLPIFRKMMSKDETQLEEITESYKEFTEGNCQLLF